MPKDEGAKARGAFFTPTDVCEFMAAWALAGGAASVLEPSCGDGEFLVAVAGLFAKSGRTGEIVGVDVHAQSSARARARVLSGTYGGVTTEVVTADFLEWVPGRSFDAVIGNPPYVRFQDLGEIGRRQAQETAAHAGVELSALASLWAAFVVKAGEALGDGGRLALVLPGELLSAGYAGAVRAYLLSRFSEINLVLVEAQAFPGVATESVLVLAAGAGQGPCPALRVSRVSAAKDLDGMDVQRGTLIRMSGTMRWSEALVEGASVVAEVGRELGAEALGTWGSVRLGTVTGANSFFVLTETRVRELGLRGGYINHVISAKALRGVGSVLTHGRLAKAAREGVATTLFYPGNKLNASVKAYIEWGEAEGINRGYKCRIRDPWWMVPLVDPAPVLVTYMNAGGVRFVANSTGAPHLNSLHGLYLLRGRGSLARALAVAGASSLSLASGELVGRSYGGGVLKVEPGEAANILVAPEALVRAKARALVALEAEVARGQREGDLFGAAEAVDRVLWGRLGAKTLDRVREVGSEAAARRRRRGQGT